MSDVVVIGAGIGGLTAAVALRRVGLSVQVLERRPEPGAIGAGIVLFPNALRALDAIGIGEQVRRAGTTPTPDDGGVAALRLPSGRLLVRSPAWEALGVVTFHRAELHAALLDRLPSDSVRGGIQLAGLTQDADGVTLRVSTAGSADELRARLVIGADGAGSVVRAAFWPGHPGLRPAGYRAWRAVTRAADRLPAEARTCGETWGPGQRFGIVPLGGGRLYWFATANLPSGGAGLRTPQQVHEDLTARFTGWHRPIPQVLAATAADDVLEHDIGWLDPPLPGYARGRVALLGDAAHAMTPDVGQGACQAIEDAVTVAAALAGGDLDHPGPALREYDRQRRPRTRRIARTAARAGRFAQLDGRIPVALRTGLMALVPQRLARAGTGSLTGWTPPIVPEIDPEIDRTR